MPIEKLDLPERESFYGWKDTMDKVFELIGVHYNKINELIDFINTREQDRSEQMTRMIDRVNKLETQMCRCIDYLNDQENRLKALEEEQESMKRVHDVHMDRTVDTMTDHRIRIEKLEKNTTQPKEEDYVLLNCPFCAITPVLVADRERQAEEWKVECDGIDCKVSPITDNFETKQEAIEAWNKRA